MLVLNLNNNTKSFFNIFNAILKKARSLHPCPCPQQHSVAPTTLKLV